MGETCPVGHTRAPHRAIQELLDEMRKGKFRTPKIGEPLSKIERYAYDAYLIDKLYEERSVLMRLYLVKLYKDGMTVELFLEEVKNTFHSLIESVIFPETLNSNWMEVNSGMGTMFTILQSIFEYNPRIAQDECIQLCRKLMRETSKNDFPASGSGNTRTRYQGAVASLVEKSPLNRKDAEDPYCPAIYTNGGNALLNDIVEVTYKHFPELGVS